MQINFKAIVVLAIFILSLNLNKANCQQTNKNRNDSIVGDVNNNSIQDYIIEEYNGHLNLRIYINRGGGKYSLIKKEFTDPSIENAITIEKGGFIGIKAFYGKESTRYYFRWYQKHNDWLCFGTETLMNLTGCNNPNLNEIDLKESFSIDGKLRTSIYSCKEAAKALEMFNSRYTEYLKEYKTKSFNQLKKHDKFETLLYLNYIPINKKNVQKYNDIGFFLNEAGNYLEASYFLENVTAFSPNRTVAYINLGDAYWGLKQMSKAKKAYQKYISLMKASGKEAKIPKRVWERIK